MVQKYQNEIPPIFYYGISTKISEKDLKIPNLQALTLGRIIKMTLYLRGRGGKFAGPSIRRIMTDPLLSNLKRLLPDSGARLPSPHLRQREEGQHDVQSAQLGELPWRLV